MTTPRPPVQRRTVNLAPPDRGDPQQTFYRPSAQPPGSGPVSSEGENFEQEEGQVSVESIAARAKQDFVAPWARSPVAAVASPAPPALQERDMLPNQASYEPRVVQSGTLLAKAHPDLAAKYGVFRDGKYLPPEQLVAPAGGGRISAQTKQMLEAVARAQPQPQPPAPTPQAPTPAAEPPKPPEVPTETGPLEELTKEERDQLLSIDDFDIDAFKAAQREEDINSPEQRRIVEARLTPLDLSDLVVKGRVSQRVIIRPNAFWFELQSGSGGEDLAIKRLVMQEARTLDASERYFLDKYSLMGIALQTLSINGKPLPGYTTSEGEFDERKFLEKFTYMMRFSVHLLACLGVNVYWFNQRVRALFKADAVGNG